ncbi:MAG TPA: hypothetical protein VHH73_16805, partial [Verrucomicrobiae bacterium]|nr:hypothetical protein [Verrucomicrobiae bacterium]
RPAQTFEPGVENAGEDLGAAQINADQMFRFTASLGHDVRLVCDSEAAGAAQDLGLYTTTPARRSNGFS